MAVNLTGVWNSLKHEILKMRKQQVRGDRQQLLDRRPQRRQRPVRLHRDQTRCPRPHQVRGTGGGRPGNTRERGVPGTIETPMVERMISAGELDRNASAANSAIPRLGRAEEIAEAVLWLCSPGASYDTGVALPVDGSIAAG